MLSHHDSSSCAIHNKVAKGREIGGFADFRNAVEAGPKSNGKWKLKRPLNDGDDGYDLAPEILQNIIKVLLL